MVLRSTLTGAGYIVNPYMGAATEPVKIAAAATTNETSAFVGPCQMAGMSLVNTSAADLYLKVYDKASAPVLASDVPVRKFAIKAGQPLVDKYQDEMPVFVNGFAYAITAALGDTDTTAVGAGSLVGVIDLLSK